MHASAISTVERRCPNFSTAQAAIRKARTAGERAVPSPQFDSVEVSVHTHDGDRQVVGVKASQLAAFVATLANDPTVVRFRVGQP